MKLLVTGGSSFLGAHFCRLAAKRHTVFAVHHTTPLRINGVSSVRADLCIPRQHQMLRRLDVDAVVHLACKIKGGRAQGMTSGEAAWRTNRALMDAVLALGCPILYASSTVVHWSQETPYGQSRKEDEARVQGSGQSWAVMRPSAPYARRFALHQPGHKESFHTLMDLVRSAPVVPVIGSGTYRRQPVHIADFSEAALRLLEMGLPNRAFDVGGGQALAFNEIIDIIGQAMGRKHVRKLHVPKTVFTQLARFAKDFDPDLIAAIDADECADPTALSDVTGVVFRGFAQGVADLIA